MHKLSQHLFLTVCLIAFVLVLQSCSEQGVQPERQKLQFKINPAPTPDGRVGNINLPENALVRVSIAGSNGISVLSEHEIPVLKNGDAYVTDVVELDAGSYVITDFIIVNADDDLYVTPKKGGEFSATMTDALPYNFSISENSAATVALSVVDVRNADLQKFGYSAKQAKGKTLSLAAYKPNGAITRATAEFRQNKKVIKTFSLASAVNKITPGGDDNIPYTLTVYTTNAARTQVVDMNKLESGTTDNSLKIMLEPALVLSLESYVEEGNEYEEYFEFRMEGSGSVNINWGNGEQSSETLPFQVSHEYFAGNYTAIVTGNVNKVTDFSGFSYSTIITAITGLTNLTALKVYDPSWGAVPIKVDLSNCKKLERINVAKYGAPYEPADLRTDFKLPGRHLISTFIFDATSFDSNREFISAEELAAFVDNIYNNTKIRKIYNGQFFVNPVVTPTAATQQKIDLLKNQYNWTVGFNDEIYEASDAFGRKSVTSDTDSRREQWLRERFSDAERIIKEGEGFLLRR